MLEHRVYGSVKKFSIDELKELFDKIDYIKIALLFGSRAVGNFTRKSDYDFAIVGDGEFQFGLQAEAWSDIAMLMDIDMDDIDVVDIQQIDSVVLDSIKEKFIILKGDKSEISRLLGKD